MPAPLLTPTTRVTWRIDTSTLTLLREVHGEGEVNEVVRAVLRAYCGHLRRARAGERDVRE